MSESKHAPGPRKEYMKYIIIDKESGESLYALEATTKCAAVIEAFSVLEVELVAERTKQEHKRICLGCQQEFTTTDARYLKCPACRGTRSVGKEHDAICQNVWCGREFITQDRRTKQCSYCRARKYHLPATMKPYCSVCDRTECLKLGCSYLGMIE